MKQLILLFLIVIGMTAKAQLIRGTVSDSSGTPLSSASVFLNNTSIGTRTDASGNFALQAPSGKYELIISSIGYQTANISIIAEEVKEPLIIKLKLKAAELETVYIQPFSKEGWSKWGKFFIENFIGTSEEAKDCKILNTEVLRFRESKEKKLLEVIALEPLQIENKALGYTLRYEMESFSFDFTTRYLMYTGYPFFEAMGGNDARQKKWEKKRVQSYTGSMLHFMRTVYANKLIEEGFEVRRLVRKDNEEKARIRAIYNVMARVPANERSPVPSDSLKYYEKILRQPDYTESIGDAQLSGDSIAYAASETVAEVSFPDYLLVIYRNKPAPHQFSTSMQGNRGMIQSQLLLVNDRPIQIHSNGAYYNPEDLLSLGYWAWSEKIALMLPLDYRP